MTSTADREIITARLVDAPRELVWEAWTDREQVAQWWGPNRFTNTVHEMDVRPGGVWRFKRRPNPLPAEAEIEIRQVFEASDFGPALTPELRKAEERLRAQAAGKR